MRDLLYGDLSGSAIGAVIEVHKVLGPGFLEGVYEAALAHELDSRRIAFERQAELKIIYKENEVGDYRADSVIGGKIILEIKSCPSLIPAHTAQALNYLAATGLTLAILLNFGSSRIQIKRIIR